MDNIEVVAKNKVRVNLTAGELFFIRAAILAWQHPREVVDKAVGQINAAIEMLDEEV